ncbi:MAG: hypothetical protein K6A65_04355 [Succinivibrionaceae bacterium]|nr:hypothetical protein [Succinivibrionaceae bacterium]
MLEQYLRNYMQGLGLSDEEVAGLTADEDHRFRLTFADRLLCEAMEGTTEEHRFRFLVPVGGEPADDGALLGEFLALKRRLDLTPLAGRAALCAAAQERCIGIIYRLDPEGLSQEDFNAHLDLLLQSAAFTKGDGPALPPGQRLPGSEGARERYLALLAGLGIAERDLRANLNRLDAGGITLCLECRADSGTLLMRSVLEAKASVPQRLSLLEANATLPHGVQAYSTAEEVIVEQSLELSGDCTAAFLEAAGRQRAIMEALGGMDLAGGAEDAPLDPGMLPI